MQAAVDPSTGKIDISILTTGITGAVRKQRADRAHMLLELIKGKGKVLVLKYQKLFEEFREEMDKKGEQVNLGFRIRLDFLSACTRSPMSSMVSKPSGARWHFLYANFCNFWDLFCPI